MCKDIFGKGLEIDSNLFSVTGNVHVPTSLLLQCGGRDGNTGSGNTNSSGGWY